MSEPSFSDQQLVAYLDELLPVDQMTSLEKALRATEVLRRRLAILSQRRDQGLHSVGEIWRRLRLSCPTRSQLGGYLLGTLETPLADYLDFHIQAVGCRICAANLRDLEQAHAASADAPRRRHRFFQSSAGYLNSAEQGR